MQSCHGEQAIMATISQPVGSGVIKIEDSPSPEPLVATLEPLPISNNVPIPVDPRDPESFLKRCAGFNKKTKLRCNSVIGQKAQQNCHPTFLPTCRTHRDQQSFAGWCQFQAGNGDRCGRLFRWTPPYFELCSEHQGHPDTPCYFFNLPLELRHEIFRYLLPQQAIGSSTATVHNPQNQECPGPCARPSLPPHVFMGAPYSYFPATQPGVRTNAGPMFLGPRGSPSSSGPFPMSILDLFLVNRRFYQEVKDLLFSTVPFKIDVRRDGTFMCGRRLLEPMRPDGSSHFLTDESDVAKRRFLKYFDWAAVKHYTVDILIEDCSDPPGSIVHPVNYSWDEEVEIYDMRDYISVVVSGVLAKSRHLCKLQVHLCVSDFNWPHEQILTNTKIVLGPFERLRNVLQPQIAGVYRGKPYHNTMLSVQRPPQSTGSMAPICSVASIPTHSPLMLPGMPDFDEYAADWSRWISSSSSSAITSNPPIRAMFTEFKDFYSKLAQVIPEVSRRGGRHTFLHRARVAREQEDVESFRNMRNELIQFWNLYLDQEERKKNDMNTRLSRMLDTDIYPSHEWEPPAVDTRRSSTSTMADLQSPVLLNSETMEKEGIPMTGNPPNNTMTMARNTSSSNPQHWAQLEQLRQLAQHAQQQQLQALMRAQQLQQQHLNMMQSPQAMVRHNQSVMPPSIPQQMVAQPLAQNDVVHGGLDLTPVQQQQQQQQQLQLMQSQTSPQGFRGSPVLSTHPEDSSATAEEGSDATPIDLTSSRSNWYVCDAVEDAGRSNGEPGPSTKRRRLTAWNEMDTKPCTESDDIVYHRNEETSESYIGKGKGKAGAEAIYLE